MRAVRFLICVAIAVEGALGQRAASKALTAEELAVLRVACNGEVITAGDRKGCAVANKQHPYTWDVEALYFGHFASSTADNAVLTKDCGLGCGSVLLEKTSGTWSALREDQYPYGSQCHKMRGPQRSRSAGMRRRGR